MATYTSNYNLKKPGTEDNALIGDLNDNADIIDAELKKRVQFDEGTGRVPLGQEPILRKELARFTASGTFNPASYPTKDGMYDIVLVGGGGSGAWGAEGNNSYGGESGGYLSVTNVSLLSGISYAVTVGEGGAGVNVTPGATPAKNGKAGGATSFAGFSTPGGQGGDYGATLTSAGTPTTANGYTHNMGGTGSGSRGGDSLLAKGGANNYSGSGGAGSLGSGGGACYKSGNDGTYYSGKGGDGVVIIYGWVGGR